MLGYFDNSFKESHLPFDLGFCPNQRSLKTLADIEMLFQTSSLCSGSSRALSKMLEKLEMVVRGEGCFFSQQWQQWSGSGSAMIGGDGGSGGGGGEFGDREGCRSAVQRLAFYIVGQLGIKVLCAPE